MKNSQRRGERREEKGESKTSIFLLPPVRLGPISYFLFSIFFCACSTKSESTYQGKPTEVSSFSLRRNTIWSNAHPSGERFVLVDSEVVRVIDQAGDEVWGRRLSIGNLRSAVFCSKGVVVLGEEGTAFLNEDGLL